jgi:hypothetical protein
LNKELVKYEKEVSESFSTDLKNELARANRVKLDSIVAMSMPKVKIGQYNIDFIILNLC